MTVGLRGAGTQRSVIVQVAAPWLRAGGLDSVCGRIGPGKRADCVAVVGEFSDDGGTDQAGTTGDKDVHGLLLNDETSVPSP